MKLKRLTQLVPKLYPTANQGWPCHHRIEEKYKSYRRVSSELSVAEGLMLFGTRIVVSKQLQAETISINRKGHQGNNRSCHKEFSTV